MPRFKVTFADGTFKTVTAPSRCDAIEKALALRALAEPLAAGERERRTARSTGTPVVLIDARHHADFREDEGGRWVTLCEAHGEFVQHSTLAAARSWLSSPEQWCSACGRAHP